MGNEYESLSYIRPAYYPQGIMQSMVQRTAFPVKIIIQLNKDDYFKGDFVEGNIFLYNNTSLILNDIYLNLFLMENWNLQDSRYAQTELNNPILLTVKIGIQKILKIDSDLINLNPGSFKFPFKFQLPDYLQPSFEYPKENARGFLRYILEAKLISQYAKGNGTTIIFIKSKPVLLKCPLSFSSAMNVHKWGMFDEGSTILKVSYPTSNYQIRGQIPLLVEINNTRGKLQVKSVNIKGIRRVQFKRIGDASVKTTFQNIMFNKDFAVNVPPNAQSQTYNYNIELTDDNLQNFKYVGVTNPYPMLVDLLFAMPTTDGAAIKCDYVLLVSLSFSSFVTQGYIPKVCIPFTMTHQIYNDANIEEREDDDMKKAIAASLLDLKKYENINDIDAENKQNEIKIDEEDKRNINKQADNFEDINKIDDNINEIQQNTIRNVNHINNNININNNKNGNQYNNINNQININNNQNLNPNNNINNNININNNQDGIQYNNINNNMNINNNQDANQFNNINNNDNINDNQYGNQYDNININKNVYNDIKFEEDNNDIDNPYQSDFDNQEQNNNFGQKNFSINDYDE